MKHTLLQHEVSPAQPVLSHLSATQLQSLSHIQREARDLFADKWWTHACAGAAQYAGASLGAAEELGRVLPGRLPRCSGDPSAGTPSTSPSSHALQWTSGTPRTYSQTECACRSVLDVCNGNSIPCLFTVVVLGLQVKAQSTCDLLRARWCEPVLSVVDIRVGDDEEAATDPFYRFGPTRFSVIPRSAVGNVSVRFVPDQVQIFPASSPGSCTCPSEMSTT